MAALTEEQALLKDQAATWAREESPVARFRAMRDAGNELGFEASTWAAIGKLGWAGILVPEEYGGVDLGFATFGVLVEELGRQLVASPLIASGLMGATALRLCEDDAQRRAWLPRIADGQAVVTLAVDEGPRHAPLRPALTAVRRGDVYTFRGQKTHVLEGMAADAFVISARIDAASDADSQLGLFLAPADADGLRRRRLATADSRGHAHLTLEDVQLPASARLGGPGSGAEALEALLDRARAGLAAEMLGVAAQAFDLTLAYLKTRVQFGQVIGGFQALGHRAAALFTEMELARSCVEAALQAIDTDSDQVPQLCSLAKAEAGEFLHHMSNELIQMHGGIGMTDELDAGLYLKRARVLEATFGNPAFHRDRYATLHGF